MKGKSGQAFPRQPQNTHFHVCASRPSNYPCLPPLDLLAGMKSTLSSAIAHFLEANQRQRARLLRVPPSGQGWGVQPEPRLQPDDDNDTSSTTAAAAAEWASFLGPAKLCGDC